MDTSQPTRFPSSLQADCDSIMAWLREALPPPADGSPAALAHRDAAALAQLMALAPRDADEVMLAGSYVL